MRTTLCVVIGFTFVVGLVPAAFAQDSRVSDQGNSAGSVVEADERQPRYDSLDGLRVESQEYAGVFVETPIGKVSVGPEFVDGAPVYVRRITATAGVTVVEISTLPFMLDLPSNELSAGVRPDQPASW
jgi:hypothetical protein